ncbi:uncharacterized protein LOC101767656 [Setaria italica]|nr:uncharacterized protein LOC101767656 [Setaria italica]
MGVLARRFLNLIVPGCTPGVKSVRRIDLAGQQLFYHDEPPPPSNGDGDGSEPLAPAAGGQDTISHPLASKMEMLRLPRASFNFRALNNGWNLNCFPFADSKVICGDQSGFGFIFDLDSRKVETMPPLLKLPTVNPVSVFVHKPHVDDDVWNDGDGSSLFLMERIPQPEPISHLVRESEQFVGFINHYPSGPWGGKCFTCRLLPPPPFVRETCSWYNNTPKITAYGVIGGGSHVCISVQGVGTYCLDTANHTWSQVGKWTLPFHGKVEYVPELKLWFGLSGDSQHLAAADLSDMDSQPQLVGGPWKELDPPDEWKECKDPQFVSLGSGRFCIARFFQEAAGSAGDEVIHENAAVFTGVEVNSSGKCGTGKEVQMTPHRSRGAYNTSIEALF